MYLVGWRESRLNPDYTQKHGRREMFEGLRKNRGSNSRQTPIFSAIRSCEAYCSIRTSNTKNLRRGNRLLNIRLALTPRFAHRYLYPTKCCTKLAAQEPK